MNKPEPPQGHWVFIPAPQSEQRGPRRPFPAIPIFIGLVIVFQAFIGWGAFGALQRIIFHPTTPTEQQQP